MRTRSDGALVPAAATIAVCTQPATTGTQPCSPLTTLYTDATLTTACNGALKDGSSAGAGNCSNPLITDSRGNYHFYAATGTYTIQSYGSGIATSFEPDISLPNTFGCQYVNATQSFAAALTAAGTTGCITVAPGTWSVSANATIPIGVTITFAQGGILSIVNAVTLAINGPLQAGLFQIFSYTGSGVVNLGATAVGLGVFPQWWGAVADGATDSAPATNKALAALTNGVGTVLISEGFFRWNSTVTMTSGQTIAGVNQPSRWRFTQLFTNPARILYFGTGSAIQVVPGAGIVADTICLRNIDLDGTNTTGAVDGFLLNGTAAASAIEGVTLQNVNINNFPRNQVRGTGVVFDISSYRLTLHNQARSVTGPLFYVDNLGSPAPSQITFDDAYLLPYTAGQWAVLVESSQDTRFIGGTISPQVTTPGANGIFVIGGLDIYGTHFEGLDATPTTNVAIRYVGSNGAIIHPAFSSFFGYQVQIGMPAASSYTTASGAVIDTSTAARGAIIGGNISNGATAGVLISAGGSRAGTVIETLGFSSGSPATISDLRLSSDGVAETTSFYSNFFSNPAGMFPAIAGGADVGKAAAPYANLWLCGGGSCGSNNWKVQPGVVTGARIVTVTDPVSPTTVGLPLTIANGTTTLTANAALAAVTSQAANTTAGTGILTTDTIEWSYASAPTAGDNLCHIASYATAGNVNFVRTNPTAAAQNVSAIVINWRVIR